MKNLVIIGIFCLSLIAPAIIPVTIPTCNAQVRKEGKTFIQEKASVDNKDIKTEYTYKDKNDNLYPIFLHKITKGDNAGKWSCYIFKTSKKTGKEYKYYLKDEEMIKQIVTEMGLK